MVPTDFLGITGKGKGGGKVVYMNFREKEKISSFLL